MAGTFASHRFHLKDPLPKKGLPLFSNHYSVLLHSTCHSVKSPFLCVYLFTCPLKLLCPTQCYHHPENTECFLIQVKVDGIQSIGRKIKRGSVFTVEGGKKEKKKMDTIINNLVGLLADSKGSLHFKAPTFSEIGR